RPTSAGDGFDLAQDLELRCEKTMGRHTNDFMTSFYSHTPSGFMVEYGWGGRCIDPATWQAKEMSHGGSLWGHERLWLDAERRQNARAVQLGAAAAGLRQPVPDLPGHYPLSGGVGPWWDQAKKNSGATRA